MVGILSFNTKCKSNTKVMSDDETSRCPVVNSPDNKKQGDSQDQVISLVIEQVAHDSVVPFGHIPNIRFAESLRTWVEIIPRPERRQLHFSHGCLRFIIVTARRIETVAAEDFFFSLHRAETSNKLFSRELPIPLATRAL